MGMLRWQRSLLALVMVFTMSVNLAALQPAAANQASLEDQVYAELEQLAAVQLQALNEWWTPMFVENGWREPDVFYRLLRPDEVVQMNCTGPDGSFSVITGRENNAVYCDGDSQVIDGVLYEGGIYIPIAPFVELLTTGEFWGQGQVANPWYIPMAIIAHEFSHHVVGEIYRQANEDQGIAVPYPGTPNNELIADCLAGAFLLEYSQVGTLTFDDVDGIIDGLILIADPDTAEVSHGTPIQRTMAFSDGFYPRSEDADTIMLCYESYWPELVTALTPAGDAGGGVWMPMVGDPVVIIHDAVPLWSTIEADAVEVAWLPIGMLVTVMDEPQTDIAGTTWVKVGTPDGYSGWVNFESISPMG